MFVQVIPTDTLTWNGNAPFHCGPYLNVLDHSFPFDAVRPNKIAPTMAYDGPGQSLPNIYSSGTRDFHAIMYLLWQPPQLKGTSTASIPVPIGHQEWQFMATADQKAPVGRGHWQQPVTNAAGGVGGFTPSQDTDNAIYGASCKIPYLNRADWPWRPFEASRCGRPALGRDFVAI
jgi:hypothetical protein